jgi:hypothetical protein
MLKVTGEYEKCMNAIMRECINEEWKNEMILSKENISKLFSGYLGMAFFSTSSLLGSLPEGAAIPLS